MNAGVFFDRDGVIIEDSHLLTRLEDVVPIEGILETLKFCKTAGYQIFLISNQTVVSRGLMSLEANLELNNKILAKVLFPHKVEEFFTDIYLSPFHPDAQCDEFRAQTPCRKPRPGMLLEAFHKYQIYPSRSFVVGDRISDIIAGNLAGCRTILFNPKGIETPLIKSDLHYFAAEAKPDYEVQRLKEINSILPDLSKV